MGRGSALKKFFENVKSKQSADPERPAEVQNCARKSRWCSRRDLPMADANLGPSASRVGAGSTKNAYACRVSGRKELHANDETEN